MDPVMLVITLFSIICACILSLTSKYRTRKSSKLPPGPYQYPIIGNILELGPKPHVSIAKLSKIYGPLMSLNLGSRTVIVVSSPELAKNVLQTNDSTFSGRVLPAIMKKAYGDTPPMTFLPAEKEWRKLRRILKEQLFSVQKLDGSQYIRQEKLQKLHYYLQASCEMGQVVDIGNMAFTTTLYIISALLFSTEFGDFNSDSSREMNDIVRCMLKAAGTPNIANYFPILNYFDLQGIYKEGIIYSDKIMAIFDRIIDEKLKSRGRYEKTERSDFLDALLELNQLDESEMSRNTIKMLLHDLFLAGTDTSSSTVEWAMTELLRNPDKMLTARSEIMDVVGENEQIQESDIPKLPYLQAIVKETLRLHPAGPLLVPHKAEADVEVNGYVVPQNAQILVNIWAIGRDSSIWTNPNSFMPERFLDNYIDFRGTDFELIPFGSGRRMCPGLPLAHHMVHFMLATFVHKFGWKLDGIEPHEIDAAENFGLTLQKATPLKAIPTEL